MLLDEPERLQAKVFGQLPADPELAAMQARQVMSSPQWQQKQQQLVTAYRQVVHARDLAISVNEVVTPGRFMRPVFPALG